MFFTLIHENVDRVDMTATARQYEYDDEDVQSQVIAEPLRSAPVF